MMALKVVLVNYRFNSWYLLTKYWIIWRKKIVLIHCYFQYWFFHHKKLLNSINPLVNFGQKRSKLIPLVTMATEIEIEIWTIFFLFLSGNDHYVKVSSNSEMVRGMALWKFFGALRELMLKRRGSAGIILSRKTIKITSGFSIPIRQHYALIDNLMRGEVKGHCPAH